MEFEEIPVERILIILWCMVVLFSDRLDYSPYNWQTAMIAIFVLAAMCLLSFMQTLNKKKPSTSYRLSKQDYMTLMESKGFHFTKEQKEAAEKEVSGKND